MTPPVPGAPPVTPPPPTPGAPPVSLAPPLPVPPVVDPVAPAPPVPPGPGSVPEQARRAEPIARAKDKEPRDQVRFFENKRASGGGFLARPRAAGGALGVAREQSIQVPFAYHAARNLSMNAAQVHRLLWELRIPSSQMSLRRSLMRGRGRTALRPDARERCCLSFLAGRCDVGSVTLGVRTAAGSSIPDPQRCRAKAIHA